MGQKYKWTIPDVKGGPIIIQSSSHHLVKKLLFILNRVWSAKFSTDALHSSLMTATSWITRYCRLARRWTFEHISRQCFLLHSQTIGCQGASAFESWKSGAQFVLQKCSRSFLWGRSRWGDKNVQVIYKRVMWWSSSPISGRRGMWLWGPIDVQC